MGSPLSLESFASGAELAKGAEDGVEGEIEVSEGEGVDPFDGGASEGGEAEGTGVEKGAKTGEEPEVGDEEPEVGEEAGGGGGATDELLLTLLNNSFGLNVDVNKGGAAGSVTGFLFVSGGGTSSVIGGCTFDFCVDLYTA